MEGQLQCVFPIPILKEILRLCDWHTKLMFRTTCKVARGCFDSIHPILFHYITHRTLGYPSCGALDLASNILYVSSNFENTIYEIKLANERSPVTKDEINYLTKDIYGPAGLAFDTTRKILYVLEKRERIIKLDPVDRSLSTLCSLPSNMHMRLDNVPSVPLALVYDPISDFLFMPDSEYHLIYKISVETGEINILCGGTKGHMDGALSKARFNGPRDLVINPTTRKLYVSDVGNQSIRAISLGENGVVRTLWNGHAPENIRTLPIFHRQMTFSLAVNPRSNYLYFLNDSKLLRFSLSLPATPEIIYENYCKTVTGKNRRIALKGGLVVNPLSDSIYVLDRLSDRIVHVKDKISPKTLKARNRTSAPIPKVQKLE